MSMSPEARRLIDEARRDASGPSDAARARVRRKVLAAAGAGAIASAAGGTAAAGGAVKAGFFASLGPIAQLGAGLVAVGVAAGGYAAWRAPEPPVVAPAAVVVTASAPVVPSIPSVTIPPVTPPRVEPIVIPSAPSAIAPVPVPPAPSLIAPPTIPTVAPLPPPPAPPASDAEALREELALIGAAQSALGRGAPEAALSSLDEHAARFPTGALSLERRALRALALCAAGRRAEGRVEADAFLARAAGSPLAERVAAACR